ncbi:MAG: 3-dehydroquinate synthase [Planctomycetes bacterium]|nr:3-dehydroquinate synthase [Planctomycetota bacterium]
MRKIPVNLGDRSYAVRVGPGLLDELGRTVASLPHAGRAVVICDSNVAAIYAGTAQKSLAKARVAGEVLMFPAGEESKVLPVYCRLMDEVLGLTPPIDRNTVVVALGGGVTGDLAGFVAATALRGLRLIQCPTSLLADVDSSVGGKTGLDHPAGKNLIGAFHQPAAVLIDVNTLTTLDRRQLLSGLAECVKHAFIRDETLLDFIEARTADILACQTDTMAELIERNVRIKAAIVSADERESGVRAHLNFGHTIGHAIETSVGLGNITHGQAVALGMVAACKIAVTRGMAPPAALVRLEGALDSLGLATRENGLDARQLLPAMRHDKKARAGKLRFVLPTAIGEVAVVDDVTEAQINQAIRYISA